MSILKKAKDFIEVLKQNKPELKLKRNSKALLASAYYIVSEQEGRPISSLKVAEIFGVSDSSVRSYLNALAEAGLCKFHRAKRLKNAYDIYAEILSKEGRTVTKLI